MGAMSKEAAALRTEMEQALLTEAERMGVEGINRDAVIKQFLGRGVGRSTIYRWAADIMASGKPGRHVAKKIREKAARRAKRSPDPSADAAREIGKKLLAPVTPVEIAGRPGLDVIGKLRETIERIEKVAKYVETPEGGVRNAGLILKASEGLRRCLDTSVRLAEAMNNLARIEQFHAEIIAEIEKESPACAERIVARCGHVCARFGG